MTEKTTGQRRKWQGIATTLASMLFLSAVALYNRYPLVWPDSGAYLYLINLCFRSIFYTLLIFPAHLVRSLWPVVFLQSLIVAHLLRLSLRVVFGIASEAAFLVITALLCMLTSLPWYTAFIMPDIFTPVLVLSFFLLTFCPERLTSVERKYVAALMALAATVHLSHLPLAIGLLLISLMVRLLMRKTRRIPLPKPLLPSLVIAAAMVLVLTSNYLTYGAVTLSACGYVFPLARLEVDGPAVSYLRASCPQRRYALCAYLDRLPQDIDTFLWSPDSAIDKIDWFDDREEGQQIVLGTIEQYPAWTMKSALWNTYQQVLSVGTGEALGSFVNDQYPTEELRTHYPEEFKAYANSRQSRGTLGDLDSLNSLHLMFLIFSLAYCCVAGVLFAMREEWLPLELEITIAVALLVNAFVAGALSEPISRYGSRVIWLVPFFAIASYRQALGLLGRPRRFIAASVRWYGRRASRRSRES